VKKVTVLGGGTGTFVVLSGLKQYPLDLAAIVTMMDSGGSTGRLRDQLGVLPPGDLRQCLVALSEASDLWRELFLYRFTKGDLKGHNFGNIFLSALEKVSENYNEVIDTASFVLKTKGKVIPVTFESTHMNVQYANGKVVEQEGNIDENFEEKTRIIKAFLHPKVRVNRDALSRIRESDYIIVGPGDLYTSIIPILLTGTIRSTIRKSSAKIIYIVNLMTKGGQTTDYTAFNHIEDITKYMGREPDYVLVNKSKISSEILEWYNSHGEKIVVNDLRGRKLKSKIITEDIIEKEQYEKRKSDILFRSILRHNSVNLAASLNKIIK
jgi:uncharacterized cofD-like protein